MSKTKVLLFDLGQVILNLDPELVFTYWAEHSGVCRQKIAKRWHAGDDYNAHEVGAMDFSTYCESLSEQLQIDLTERHWRAGWNNLFVSAFTEVLDEIQRLKSQFPIYAFTNTNPTHEQEWQRRYSDELAVFSKIYVSSKIQMRKPNLEAYEYVCKDMGVAPSEVLFFDDLHENIVGANNAGLQTQLVDHESTTVSRLKQFK